MTDLIVDIPARPKTSYPITIGFDLFDNTDLWIPEHYQKRKLVIITDDRVNTIYEKKIINAFKKFNHHVIIFSSGEKNKNQKTKEYIETQMISHHCDRQSMIIALGGGVVGDIAGFVASTYMRGIPYIQVPTTLLAMIDSSIGGKTAINTDQGKNLIGTFWHPIHVLADIYF